MGQEIKIFIFIPGREKNFLVTIATLDNMMGEIGNNYPGLSWHRLFKKTGENRMILKGKKAFFKWNEALKTENVCVTFFKKKCLCPHFGEV